MGMSAVAGCLERIGGVGQHQIHIFRHKAVHDGGAVVVLAAGVLLVKLHPILAEGLHQSRLEAPGGCVQRVVGGELADTHQIGLPPGAAGGRLIRFAVSAAGGQADGHNAAQGKSGQFSSIHNRVPPIPTAL